MREGDWAKVDTGNSLARGMDAGLSCASKCTSACTVMLCGRCAVDSSSLSLLH